MRRGNEIRDDRFSDTDVLKTLDRRHVIFGLLIFGVAGLGLVALLTNLHPSILAGPSNGWQYPVRPMVLIVAYVGLGIWQLRSAEPSQVNILIGATRIGLVAAAIEVLSIGLETFLQVPHAFTTVYTGMLILIGFAVWTYSGYRAAEQTRSIIRGILASVWTALVGILIGVTFGMAVTYLFLPFLTPPLATDPDFLRSEWKDLTGFAIVNTLDNAFAHLVMAPMIAVVVGSVGGFAALRRVEMAE